MHWQNDCETLQRHETQRGLTLLILHRLQAALLFALLGRRKRSQPSARKGGPAQHLQDVLRYTSFLGAFAGVFVAVDEGLAACFGNKK